MVVIAFEAETQRVVHRIVQAVETVVRPGMPEVVGEAAGLGVTAELLGRPVTETVEETMSRARLVAQLLTAEADIVMFGHLGPEPKSVVVTAALRIVHSHDVHRPPIEASCPGLQRHHHPEEFLTADFHRHPPAREHGGVAAIGLVLGAGGVVGGAYHAGALAALAEAANWDARDAEIVVGTSAGSIAGAALRAGLSGADQFARATSGDLSAEGERLVGGQGPITDLPTRPPFPRGLPLPASPQLAATALLPPWRARPVAALAGLLPAGSVPTAPIGDRIRMMFDDRWPDRSLWICALRLRDGQRVVFGRDDVDVADVGIAVEASCAIPGYLQPVAIGSETYVDGGTHSPSNADLVAGLGLDLVVVISTMSAPWTALRPSPSIGSRALASWVLEREVRAVRASGTPVLVLEPTAEDLAVMGSNALDPARRAAVAEQARSTTVQRLAHPAAADLLVHLAA